MDEPIDLSTPGARLEYARKASGLGQRALSKRAGLSDSFIGAFMTRHRREPNGTLDPESARALARALGIEAGWILWREGPDPSEERIRAAVGPDVAEEPLAPTGTG